jgi:ABC-type dipeptide/oligopeptide/nickel transport system permease subunit
MATVTRPLPGQVVEERRSAGLWSDAFGRLRKNRLALLGLIMVILLLFFGIFGPFLAPWPYAYQDLKAVVAGGGGPLPPARPGTSWAPTSSVVTCSAASSTARASASAWRSWSSW